MSGSSGTKKGPSLHNAHGLVGWVDRKQTSVLWTLMSPTYESESHTDWGQWPKKVYQGMSASQGELGWGVEGGRGQEGMGLPWPHLSCSRLTEAIGRF